MWSRMRACQASPRVVSRWRRRLRPRTGTFHPWRGRKAADWESPRRAFPAGRELWSVRSGGHKARHPPRPTCRPRGRASSPARGRRWQATGPRGRGGPAALRWRVARPRGVDRRVDQDGTWRGRVGSPPSHRSVPTARAMLTASRRLSAASAHSPRSRRHSPRRPWRRRTMTRFLPALASCSAWARCSSLKSPCQKRN